MCYYNILLKKCVTIICYPLWLQSINIAIMSYTRILRITLKTQKGFIDEKKFKLCIVRAFEVISKAVMEIPNKNKD